MTGLCQKKEEYGIFVKIIGISFWLFLMWGVLSFIYRLLAPVFYGIVLGVVPVVVHVLLISLRRKRRLAAGPDAFILPERISFWVFLSVAAIAVYYSALFLNCINGYIWEMMSIGIESETFIVNKGPIYQTISLGTLFRGFFIIFFILYKIILIPAIIFLPVYFTRLASKMINVAVYGALFFLYLIVVQVVSAADVYLHLRFGMVFSWLFMFIHFAVMAFLFFGYYFGGDFDLQREKNKE